MVNPDWRTSCFVKAFYELGMMTTEKWDLVFAFKEFLI